MNKLTALLFLLLLGQFGFSQSGNELLRNQIIVKFKNDSKPTNNEWSETQLSEFEILNHLNQQFAVQSIKLTGNKKELDTYVLELASESVLPDCLKAFQETGLFTYVEPNFIAKAHGMQFLPNDAQFSRQWYHVNNGTFSLSNATPNADMDTDLAWEITQGNPDLIVAVLDTGLRLTHPEFNNRIWINPGEVLNGLDSDANGYIDDSIGGWDFVNGDNSPTDDHGHGTNITGVALASGNNNIGYAGMNWNSKVMVCKVLNNENTGFYSWIVDAIYYAVFNGASVINISIGGNDASTFLEEAINFAYANNVAVVVSTGNQNGAIQYPAKYANAFAVGSTDPDDTRSAPFFWDNNSGSNFGPELDFVAPGNFIFGLNNNSDTNYDFYWGGTSQAAPQVAGLISLMLSANPNLTVDQIRFILENTAEDQVGDSFDTPGWDQYYGNGRINAHQALLNATLSTFDFDSNNDNISIYPNPVKPLETIHIEPLNDGNYEVEIYNILGQEVYKLEKITTSFSFQLPILVKGAYLLKIKNLQNKKLVLKKLAIE